MKPFIKSLLFTFLICSTLLLHGITELGYVGLLIVILIAPVFVILLVIFYFYFKFTDKITPLVIGYVVMVFLLSFGDDLYYFIREQIGKESFSERASYYYYGDSEYLITTEIRYKNYDNIRLENTELIEYPTKEDVYFNQKNEFIYSKILNYENRKEFVKLDTNGKIKDSEEYSENTFIYDDKIVDFDTDSYSNWLNSDDKTSYKVKLFNEDFSYSIEQEKELLDETIKSTPKPVYLFLHTNNKKCDDCYKVLFKQNDKLCIFYTTINVFPKMESVEKNEAFFKEKFLKDRHPMYFLNKKMPFSSVFIKKSLSRNGLWFGILYSKIPLGKDTLYVATINYIENNKIRDTYKKYKDDVEEIEDFADIGIYKNKNINYALLRINDKLFVVKELNKNKNHLKYE